MTRLHQTFFTLLIALLLILAILLNQTQENIKESKEELLLLQKQVDRIITLQERWQNKKKSNLSITMLTSSVKPASTTQKGNITQMKFEALDRQTLKILINKVMQSSVKINRFEITRQNDFTADVALEVSL